MTTLAASSRAAVISVANPASNVWSSTSGVVNADTYTYNAAAGLFSPANFVVDTFVDGNSGDFNVPYGDLIFPNGTNMMANNGYSRAGTLFNASSSYQNGPGDIFYNSGVFTSGAMSGANNYVGIEIADTNGKEHYGWLEYTLAPYSNGATAVVFDGGYLNDVAGMGVVAGVVPEPSTLAAAIVGLCALVGGRWLRRRAAHPVGA